MLNNLLRLVAILVFLVVFRAGILFTLLFFSICLILFAWQAIFPVSSIPNIFQTIEQLILSIFDLNGPLAKVVNGRLSQARWLQRQEPGAALLDINSAMVLERVVIPGFMPTIQRTIRSFVQWLTNQIRTRQDLPLITPTNPVRVCGPGLTFIEFDERIQGVSELDENDDTVDMLTGLVDLRRQFRNSGRGGNARQNIKNASVRAYTRDGIELGTNVNSLFTIGQDTNTSPHVLQISFEGETQADWTSKNLRVLNLQDDNGAVLVQRLEDTLEPTDRAEIFTYFIAWRLANQFPAYQVLPIDPNPPTFNPERVFSAVYSQAYLRDNPAQMVPWTDLPVRLTTDLFRELLSRVNFNELYMIGPDGEMGINRLRTQVRIGMRNSGMLSYRLVFRRAFNRPLRSGQRYRFENLTVSPLQALRSPKVLRDRGIQMLAAGFGPLLPANDIYLQWLNNWRAEWESETMTEHAIADLEARRVYNRARIQKQQELAISLQKIFEETNTSKEVIAIRLLQALESIAADRDTRRLLPAETISMLQSIHSWLLPQDLGLIR
jgi:hypothetical protein